MPALVSKSQSDIVPYLAAAAAGSLTSLTAPVWRDEAIICVVVAAKGYPEAPQAGAVIRGAEADFGDDVTVFHAGTARGLDGTLVAAGGRVLNVCARARISRRRAGPGLRRHRSNRFSRWFLPARYRLARPHAFKAHALQAIAAIAKVAQDDDEDAPCPKTPLRNRCARPRTRAPNR